ncbi:MAG: glycosyltransferase family 2 protein, partial [Chloroflexi bacterium]|nr:glycosyltransferase family 2 protein [Chloroflexota bacterium]
MKLTVIIPIYNEARTLREILNRVLATSLADEILLVDDGSTDGTRDLLAALEGRQGIRVILHAQNQGKGAAVRTGISAATGDVILI